MALRLLLALALVVAPLAGAPPAGAQEGGEEPTVELRSDLVLVNAVARRGAGWASGLTRDDFALAEDGEAQELAFFGAEETPFAAAILIDTSGSMEHKLTLARAAAARFLDRTRPEDQVAVYAFANSVKRIQDFTPGRRDIAEALWDTSADGYTRMYDCVDEATTALAARPEQRRAILLLSDGADTRSGVSQDAVLRRALAAGVTLYTIDLAPIGGRKAPDPQEMAARGALRGMAEKTGGRFFSSRGGTDLNDAFTEIVDELSHLYTLGYYPTNSRRDGRWRRIEVTTKLGGVTLRTRPGYHAPKD
jgi:Ca-activated chloride channel family protein